MKKVVLFLIAIFAVFVTFQIHVYRHLAEEGRVTFAHNHIAAYGSAIELYSLERGVLPNTLDDVLGGELRGFPEMKFDPWGNEYVYRVDNNSYEVFSAGPDGVADTDDDIRPME